MKHILACHGVYRRTCLVSWSLLFAILFSAAIHFATGWPGFALRIFWHCAGK